MEKRRMKKEKKGRANDRQKIGTTSKRETKEREGAQTAMARGSYKRERKTAKKAETNSNDR